MIMNDKVLYRSYRGGTQTVRESLYCRFAPSRGVESERPTMPPTPTWFQRLLEILDVLRGIDAGYLDRQAVEKLFGVGPRRAR